MSESKDDATPGPSNADPGPSNEQPTPSSKNASKERIKKISFADRSHLYKENKTSSSSHYKRRQSSIIGTPGYISQLVEELEEPEVLFKEEAKKPIRKQSIEERRNSIKEIESDIKHYMKAVARMSIAERKESTNRLPTVSNEKLEEIRAASGTKISDLRGTEWVPSKLLGADTGDKIERSWVGTYIVGKDYWTPQEKNGTKKEAREIEYAIDSKRKSWYEVTPGKPTPKEESTFLKMKTKSLDTLDALKDEMDKEFLQKREERMISAAEAREQPTEIDEWTDAFKMNFQTVAKSEGSAYKGRNMSLADIDKWLEKAGILDHLQLTGIHTGLCFLASGGKRDKGLTFEEFTHFLQMISYTTGIPVRDLTKRLEVCLRKEKK